MADLGHFALILGLFLAGYAVIVDLLGAWRKETGLIDSGRNATVACWLCLTVASAALLTLLLRRDFSVTYVAQHTSSELPLAYTISAFWAGAAGSLLLWLWLQVGFVALVFCRNTPNQKVFAAGARAAANLVGAFFLLVLILDKNPFAQSAVTPSDGTGLNPLLQHPAMALHPPTLFVGYAAFAIPFAWAFASLGWDRGTVASPFFRQNRNWILWAWLFLTIGIALGAWWAYEELGWGGYWAWDPVENSSLMPWLIATALLHCSRTYNPRTSIAIWLKVLGIVTFSLCIFGTFLTRYGLVSSVHAFPEPGLGILFLVLLVIIWIAAAYLLWRYSRSQAVEPPQTTGPFHRRFIVLNNWLMILLTFLIFVGTLFPFFSGLLTEQKITLKSDYFTKITAPPGLVLLFFMALCPYVLRHGIGRNWRILGGAIFGVTALAVWLLTGSLAIPCFIICGFAAAGLAVDLFGRNSAAANSGVQGAGHPKGLRWYGARIAHLSVVLIFFGIAGSGAYEVEKQAALTPGQSMDVGKFSVRYDDISAEHLPAFTAVTADVTVSRNQRVIAKLKPSRAYYRREQQTSEVDIRRTLAGDFYVAVTAVDTSTSLINLRVLIKPLINWIWIGSSGLVIGALLVLFSFYRPRTFAK
jgi:cytochrome c-type biogenesis protein CcmF